MGRSIRIYLADGDVTGVRHGEIVNWTGQALAFSRNSLSELREWQDEVRRQGVYFLIGKNELADDTVYIGEAEVVAERIPQHLIKDFWTECVAFTSKDQNLTKSHIKYLESRLLAQAIEAGRFQVENSNTPTESKLPRADRDAMDEFAANIRILLGVLGHRVLDPAPQPLRYQFSLNSGTVSAAAFREGDEFVVTAGSTAAAGVAPSLAKSYQVLREKLIASGVLTSSGNQLVFSRNYPFTAPSAAAAVVVGYPINGRQAWKSPEGASLAEIEEAEANAVEEAFARAVSTEPIE